MTDFLADIASYQAGIDLAKVKAAGFGIVNIKTSEGTGYTFSAARAFANAAKVLGQRVSLFHFLTGGASGSAQAAYAWKTAGPIVQDIGPVAFQVDNESTATWEITRDFVHAISDKLGHLPYMYTGDWWAAPRMSWDVHSLTPWLMAAPNAGYPGAYPGDASPQWWAGYWGYENLSLMQYAVSPIDGAGGGNISKTAIRDPHLWAALIGGDDMDQSEPLVKPWQGASVGNALAVVMESREVLVRDINSTGYSVPLPDSLAGRVVDIQKTVKALDAGQVDPEAVKAAVKVALQDPDVVAGLVKAINDDAARRAAE